MAETTQQTPIVILPLYLEGTFNGRLEIDTDGVTVTGNDAGDTFTLGFRAYRDEATAKKALQEVHHALHS